MTNRIEKLQWNFLWGRVGEKFDFHLVSWSKICTLISFGDLGIKNLLMFNRALLGNWLWSYAIERKVLWRSFMEFKYDSMWGGGVLIRFLGLSGLGYGNSVGGVGETSLDLFDLRWVMGLR